MNRFLNPLSVCFAFLALTFVGAVHAGSTETGKAPIQVLFVGNSYTLVNHLPALVAGLSKNDPRPIRAVTITSPGASLKEHWRSSDVLDLIRTQRWEYVVLQEQSAKALHDKNTMFEYARLLNGEIKKVGAKTVLFTTWARRSAPEEQARITAATKQLGKELDAIVAPVGPAWEKCREIGKLQLHNRDGSHPNPLGTYVAACVFYGLLSGTTPVGLSPACIDGHFLDGQNGKFETRALKDDIARTAQQYALETLKDFGWTETVPRMSITGSSNPTAESPDR